MTSEVLRFTIKRTEPTSADGDGPTGLARRKLKRVSMLISLERQSVDTLIAILASFYQEITLSLTKATAH